MFRVLSVTAALLAAPAVSAASYSWVDGPAVHTGQDYTQTIRISGIDPLVDSVSLWTLTDVEYGLNWLEDDGDGPYLSGNEYFDFFDHTLDVGQSFSSTGMVGDLFIYHYTANLMLDGSDVLATLRLQLGSNDIRCDPSVHSIYEDCGVRPIFGMFSTEVTVSGPGANGAIITDTSFVTPAAPAVPEPAAWLMLITGFGLVGASLRRRTAALA